MGGEIHYRECAAVLVKLLSPFAPFITHELWERLGEDGMVCEQGWPVFDSSFIINDQVEFVLQVNGKIRDRVVLPGDTSGAALEELAFGRDRIRAHLTDKQVVKVIFVEKKLLNIVVR